jgi:hypothetical protein
MNYLVAVLKDRNAAEEAYTALEKAGLALQDVGIVGKGFREMDSYKTLQDPSEDAKRQSRWMAVWLVPFGFFGGVVFTQMTQFQTFSWAGYVGNYVVGGIVGSLSGLMGSVFVGGGVSLLFGGKEGMPLRQHLAEGRYLVIASGSEGTMRKAIPILEVVGDLETLKSFADSAVG